MTRRGNGLRSTSPASSHQLSRHRTSDRTCHTDVTLSEVFDSNHKRNERTSSPVTRPTSMSPKNGSIRSRTL